MMCGLEIHVQLETESKLFCDCPTNYQDAPANTNICPICLNQPGAKPHPTNEKALENALMIALMLNCEIDQDVIYFMRKHYDYPDLSSGYQRTSVPIGINGELNGIRIREIHAEEDPGQFKPDRGIVNFNRSGIPLVEIVTEPDIKSPEEARNFLKELIRVLQYSGGARGEGTMRADVNISINGGNRVEMKNVNSIKGAYKALKFELVRQKNLMKRGVEVKQETRAYLESQMITVGMRMKEDADDYRFITDPDLPPMQISDETIQRILDTMPEAPHNKVKRFVEDYDIDQESAKVLTSELDLAIAYEEVVKKIEPKFAAKWMKDELKRVLSYNKLDFADSEITVDDLIEFLSMIESKEVTAKAAKKIIEQMPNNEKSPKAIAEEMGLLGVVNDDEILAAVKQAIEENPKAVEDYLAGQKASINFLMGQVMKLTRGKADPGETVKLLKENIEWGNIMVEKKSFVKDYMTKNVICVSPDTPTSDIIDLMRTSRHNSYPVVENDKLVGMVTAFDVVSKEWADTVEGLMSTKLVVANPELSINDASRVMFRRGISRMPVVDEDRRIVGIITNTDMVRSHIERSTPNKVEYFKNTLEQLYDIKANIKLMSVDTHKLRPTQDRVYADELEGRAYELKRGLAEPAIVVKTGERWILVDGHHRAVASLQQGYETVDSYVIDLGQDIKLGMEKTANKAGIYSFNDIEIIDDDKHPLIALTESIQEQESKSDD